MTIGGFAFSQDPVVSLNVSTKDDDSGKKLPGSVVEVYKDGKLFITKTSASDGRVPSIDLPLGANYKIVIKKPGYVAKVATFAAFYDHPEDLPSFVPFPIQTSLFKEVEGVDFEWLEKTPMIKFELDQFGQQSWDKGYTNDMLKKIEDLKKEMAEKAAEDAKKKADFDAYVKAGDLAVPKKDYEKAIDNYNKALEIFDEADVKKKRDDAQKAKDESEAGAELEKKFQDLMTEAKDKYSAKSYPEALELYKEASGLKPAEKLPKDRIAEIEKLLADSKAQDEKFNKFVADGDKAVGTESYDDAISNYESALGIKDDAGVKTKLEDAKKKKAEKENADAAAKELEEKYNALMTAADKGFDAKTYADAKTKYEEALALKPGESRPAARISEIDGILKKDKDAADALKRLEEQYAKLIDESDAAFADSKWQESIDTYNEALKLKSGEKYPKDQIAIAEKNLADEKANAAKDEAYNKLMADAKGLKDGEKYAGAISKYKEALAEKPGEAEPTAKIKEIEALMADLEAAEEKEAAYKKFMDDGSTAQGSDDLTGALEQYKKALVTKPGDTPAQTKIDEVNKLIKDKAAADASEKEFKDLVALAQKDFGSKEYTDAKKNYQKALDIKDDASIKEKINEIDGLLAASQDAAEQQQKYDAAMKAADQAFAAKSYEDALSKYQDALAIKDEPDAKNGIDKSKAKIAELADAAATEKKFNDLIAEGDDAAGNNKWDAAINKYREAIKMRPDPSVSKKILDIEALIKSENANNELLGKYRAKIKEADEAFNADSWESAKTLYADAIDIKDDEQYPKDQLLEIDRKMKEESQNEIEKQYQKILTVAQTKMDAEDYDKAIELFNKAKDMKPSDPLPQSKIDEINAIKAAKEAELADKEAFEKKYKDLITKADKAFEDKDYDAALNDYRAALTMKPTESHPKDRVDEIKVIQDQLNAGKDLDEKYQAAIDKADGLFNSDSFMEAKTAYQDALDIKGSEQYPLTQIAECDAKLQEISADEVEKQYQKILTVAQKKFDESNYDKALEYYNRAKDMKPSDPLPQNKIDEINQLLADLTSDMDNDEKYKALIQKADNQFESKKWKEALDNYMAALDIFSDKQYPKDQVEKCREGLKNSGRTGNEAYAKLIKKADEYFNAATYDKAKNLYKRAVKLKPSDQYPKDQLKEIEKILHPPKVLTANSAVLKDYGPAINEKPIDIEAMLREAEEADRFAEYEAAYRQRDEAGESISEWAQSGYDEGFLTREEAELLQTEYGNTGDKGEKGRVESRDKVI
ncbi:MAG: epidermal growth factor receptor substrate 15, partial [Arenicella sp.]